MKIKTFETERYYAKYEFTSRHLLSVSDCESVSIEELLQYGGHSFDELGKIRLGYTESQGDPSLRAKIAERYLHVRADQVLILNSPIEGIYITMRALLGDGDEAIILSPAYDALINLPESISSGVFRWQLEPTANGWELELEKLQKAISRNTKLLVVNFPHNPSGFLPQEEELARLVELADKHGIWLFCDEMYRGLEYGQRATLPSAADLYQRSIVLAGLSKSHGLPGLRAGWLIVRNEALLQEISKWKDYTSICSAAPTEFLAQVALDAEEKLVQRNVKIISDNIRLADDFFSRWSEMFEWRKPDAGSVAMVGINVPSATQYCHQLAEEAGIVLLPTKFMGYDDRHVRFGFGRLSFPAALAAYEDFLDKHS